MQSLDAAVKHFGKTGYFADIDDGQTCVAQSLGGATRAHKLEPKIGQALGEINRAGLVGQAD